MFKRDWTACSKLVIGGSMVNITGDNHGGACDNTNRTHARGCTGGVSFKDRGHKNTHGYRVLVIFILLIYFANFDAIKTTSLQ